jgi:hypothetical protein
LIPGAVGQKKGVQNIPPKERAPISKTSAAYFVFFIVRPIRLVARESLEGEKGYFSLPVQAISKMMGFFRLYHLYMYKKKK